MSKVSERPAYKANHRCFWQTFCEKDDPGKSRVTTGDFIAHPLVKPHSATTAAEHSSWRLDNPFTHQRGLLHQGSGSDLAE